MNPFDQWMPTYRAGCDWDPNESRHPWWSADQENGLACWLRSDGLEHWGSFEQLAEVDARNPLPAPHLLVGQVWSGPNGDAMAIDFYTPDYPLTDTERGPAWGLSVDKYVSHTGRCVLRSEAEMRAMLDGAVLVYGPGAPWAPVGWRP